MRYMILSLLACCAMAGCEKTSAPQLEPAAEEEVSFPAKLNGPALPASKNLQYAGVYAGSYVCAYGENGITLSLDTIVDLVGGEVGLSKVEGRLWFYDVMSNQGHPKGAFKLAGTLTSEGELEVKPAGWISEIPANWGAAGVSGSVSLSDAGDYLNGQPTGPGTSACQPFQLMRLDGLK